MTTPLLPSIKAGHVTAGGVSLEASAVRSCKRANSFCRRFTGIALVGMLMMGLVPVSARSEKGLAPWPGARPSAVLSPEDDALLEELQRSAFRYFDEQADPKTGLVRDRARSDGSPSEGKASIAASGFSLSAWAVATQRGWTDRDTALRRVRLALHFLAEKAPRRHGFFYHFMEMDTGERAWRCELSPIDTGLFFAGAIVAREYFGDPEVTTLVNRLFHDVDWEWFLNGGSTLAMGWHDEHGFSRYRWDKYSEDMMLGFLGTGALERPLPEGYWDAWSRTPVGTYAGYHFIEGPQLFIHQFTHAHVDFRDLRDAYADYYHNSVLATLAQRQFCVDLRGEFPAWAKALGDYSLRFGDRLQGLGRASADRGSKCPRWDDSALCSSRIGRVCAERGHDDSKIHAHGIRGSNLEPIRVRGCLQP